MCINHTHVQNVKMKWRNVILPTNNNGNRVTYVQLVITNLDNILTDSGMIYLTNVRKKMRNRQIRA